jgi:hypothetical protein
MLLAGASRLNARLDSIVAEWQDDNDTIQVALRF